MGVERLLSPGYERHPQLRPATGVVRSGVACPQAGRFIVMSTESWMTSEKNSTLPPRYVDILILLNICSYLERKDITFEE